MRIKRGVIICYDRMGRERQKSGKTDITIEGQDGRGKSTGQSGNQYHSMKERKQ
ncbi:MAG TPA: hypothetical protein IAB48_05345 [Candidatus Fimimorpha excrementavium]|nr:hypothetical protein [Candidatus Fimimorpha excrementavium]